ncbi:hypothetical protein CPC08DRAFT_99022 [Agrocybe pediades]|nr:hypothetical protein CPC08DRAFT_99022 [Agrocybe pediades]
METITSDSRSSHRARTILDLHRERKGEDKLLAADSRLCPACRRPAAGKKGSLVIACGDSFLHLDCYKCKTCRTTLEIEDTIMLDRDGLPLCENCFLHCNACQLPVSDEVIFIGDSSQYHSHCFKCKKCDKSLDQQKFARSRQSVYCQDCYNRRLDKMKRLEKKKEMLERQVYGGISSPLT